MTRLAVRDHAGVFIFARAGARAARSATSWAPWSSPA
jgi:hypothetical protein